MLEVDRPTLLLVGEADDDCEDDDDVDKEDELNPTPLDEIEVEEPPTDVEMPSELETVDESSRLDDVEGTTIEELDIPDALVVDNVSDVLVVVGPASELDMELENALELDAAVEDSESGKLCEVEKLLLDELEPMPLEEVEPARDMLVEEGAVELWEIDVEGDADNVITLDDADREALVVVMPARDLVPELVKALELALEDRVDDTASEEVLAPVDERLALEERLKLLLDDVGDAESEVVETGIGMLDVVEIDEDGLTVLDAESTLLDNDAEADGDILDEKLCIDEDGDVEIKAVVEYELDRLGGTEEDEGCPTVLDAESPELDSEAEVADIDGDWLKTLLCEDDDTEISDDTVVEACCESVELPEDDEVPAAGTAARLRRPETKVEAAGVKEGALPLAARPLE